MKKEWLLKIKRGSERRTVECSAKQLEVMIHNSKIGEWKFVEITRKNESKDDLKSYMNRDNYLKDFDSIEKINKELWYIGRRLQDKNPKLVEDILVLKMNDLEQLKKRVLD